MNKYGHPSPGVEPEKAKQLLIGGNKRFVSGNLSTKDTGPERRRELLKGQKPFAVIVCCSDSRVPPELLFDQALGDIFVVRVAGNIVDPVAVGSVEYAVEHLNTPLVVVLGHDHCGAVKAAIDGGEAPAPGSIGAIVSRILPSVQKAKAAGASGPLLYEKSEDENVRSTIKELFKSPILKHFAEDGRLMIVGAKYFLESGEVLFGV